MARPVYSERLAQVLGLSGLELVSIPAGFTAVLRDFDVYWGGGVIRRAVFLRGAGGQTIFYNSFGDTGGQYASWRGRQVIQAGETFSIFTEDAMDVTLSGYLLTLP